MITQRKIDVTQLQGAKAIVLSIENSNKIFEIFDRNLADVINDHTIGIAASRVVLNAGFRAGALWAVDQVRALYTTPDYGDLGNEELLEAYVLPASGDCADAARLQELRSEVLRRMNKEGTPSHD